MSKATNAFFSIRLVEKLKSIAEKLEGDSATKSYIATSRFGKLWFLPIFIGILIWGGYTFFVVKKISANPNDVVIFLCLLPYIILLISLIFLLTTKKMVLVYSWKEFIYYPVIFFITFIICGGGLLLYSQVTEDYGHSLLVLLLVGFVVLLCFIWLTYIAVRTILVNRHHPFMATILALLKTIIWIFVFFHFYGKYQQERKN